MQTSVNQSGLDTTFAFMCLHRTSRRLCDEMTKKDLRSQTFLSCVYPDGMDTTTTIATQKPPAPVSSKERVVLLDVIRGFALGGVFLSNVFLWFSGRFLLPPTFWQSYKNEGVNAAGVWIFRNLVFGRFITIFSFLFGLGIAMQFFRAQSRDDSGGWRYTRRAMVMILFGALHLSLVWYGDILHIYALFGFSLLLFRRASTKTLIIAGALLTFLVPLVAQWGEQLLPLLWTTAEAMKEKQTATMTHMQESNAQLLSLLQSTSFVDIVRGNVLVYWKHFARIHVLGFYLGLVGNFLLGFAAGRVELFAQVDKHRRLFRHLLGWGLLTGILGNLGMMVVRNSGPGKDYFKTNEHIVTVLSPFMREVSTLGMAAFYVAAITLLFQRSWGQRILSVYAPVGRMAITNYLSQSVLSLFIFTGIGLGKIGTVSAVWLLLMPTVVFVVQMVLSWLWLKRFSYGPMEWLWRRMTYGSQLSMKESKSEAPVVKDEPPGEAAVEVG